MIIQKPSEGEVEILQVLWENQPCSVRKIHEQISQTKNVGYTSVLKQLQRMKDKGLVTRSPGAGKSFNYCAAQPAEKIQSSLLGRLIDTAFRGSVNELVMHALGGAEPTDEELDTLKSFIKDLESKNKRGTE